MAQIFLLCPHTGTQTLYVKTLIHPAVFSPGVCLSFHQERATAAPGDGLLHFLLPCRLQPGKTLWLQATNGK